MSIPTTYIVNLNYPSRKNDDEKGIAINYRQDLLRKFRSYDEAVRFARSHSLRPNDYVYVVRDNGSTVFFRSPKKEGSPS